MSKSLQHRYLLLCLTDIAVLPVTHHLQTLIAGYPQHRYTEISLPLGS